MTTIPIPRDFREFIFLLNAENVRYVIVGGYAVAYHGYPRATADLDIFIDISKSNSAAVLAALKKFGFSHPQITSEFFQKKGRVFCLGREPLRLEIINDIDGVTFAECYKHRIKTKLGDLPINFVDLARLKRNKKASGRAKDLADLEQLAKLPTTQSKRSRTTKRQTSKK